MSAKHSPGPWRFEGGELVDANGEGFLECYIGDDPERDPMVDANRRLIANAPECADELRAQLDFIAEVEAVLAKCYSEYHGSPLEEAVDDRKRSLAALLARIGKP